MRGGPLSLDRGNWMCVPSSMPHYIENPCIYIHVRSCTITRPSQDGISSSVPGPVHPIKVEVYVRVVLDILGALLAAPKSLQTQGGVRFRSSGLPPSRILHSPAL